MSGIYSGRSVDPDGPVSFPASGDVDPAAPPSRLTMTQKVLDACWQVMQRQGLQPFDRNGNRDFHWFISPELVEHEWRPDMRNEIAGIPVILAPRGGSIVELLKWVDGANVHREDVAEGVNR